jgi:hypothetical protein
MSDRTTGPAAPCSLLIVAGPGKGEVIPLPAGELVLGRNSPQGSGLADDPLLSRRHARVITGSGGHVYIEDLGSSNGTRLNGERVDGRQLVRPGGLIQVGGSTLRLAEPSARAGDRAVQVDDRTVIQRLPGDGEPLGESRTGSWDGPFGTSVPPALLFGSADSIRAAPSPPIPRPVAPPGRPAGSVPAAPERGTVTLTGRVRGFERRSERMGEGSVQIYNFRLERYDAHGNRERPVPVQLRGWKIDGSLRDEDEVAVTGRMKNGTMRGQRVENHTTGATIAIQSVKRGNMIGCLLVIAFFVVAGLFFGLVALLGG